MNLLLHSLKTKKYLIQAIIYFVVITTIYFMLDYLNLSYKEMKQEYGLYLVILNLSLNIVMALLTSLLMLSSEIMIKGTKSSSLGFFAIIFGLFTYGCAPCLISFVASLGIVLTVMVLPLAGLPYKLISLALILVGLFFSLRRLRLGCKVKIKNTP